MKQTNRFLIYGATGYTGKLTARTAKEKGLEPILAGRNEVKLKALGEPLGFQSRAFDLSDKAKLDTALGRLMRCCTSRDHFQRPPNQWPMRVYARAHTTYHG